MDRHERAAFRILLEERELGDDEEGVLGVLDQSLATRHVLANAIERRVGDVRRRGNEGHEITVSHRQRGGGRWRQELRRRPFELAIRELETQQAAGAGRLRYRFDLVELLA